jgi:NADPH-dependent curcumin reductase CurA
MSSGINREIHLAARPQGWPTLDTFALVATPIPEPTEGQVLVRNVFMSVVPTCTDTCTPRRPAA